jgi:cysteine desulfuration protein SufE
VDTLERIVQTFEFFESWEDRYRYLIDLGRKLPPMAEEDKTEDNRVRGCTSRVWVRAETGPESPARLHLVADSDAQIVKGLVALLVAVYSGKTAAEALAFDVRGLLTRLDLQNHLSPSRSNGLFSMVERIQARAREIAAGA